jgi:hypothetical protein
MCFSLLSFRRNACAQTDSITHYSKIFERIAGKTDWSIGKVRGFTLGDSIHTVLRLEEAILEAQGDDFLYYRVLCDSTFSAEISYTFNESGILISIGIEFFESCRRNTSKKLSEEFLINLTQHYGEADVDETGFLQWKGHNGVQVEYQKKEKDACMLHTEMEFY